MEKEVKFRVSEELYEKIKKYIEEKRITLKEFFIQSAELMLNFDIDRIIPEILEKESKLDSKLRKQLMSVLEQIRLLKMYKKHLLEEIERIETKIMYRKRALKVLYCLEDYMRTLDLMIQLPESLGKDGKEYVPDIREIVKQLRTIYNRLMYHIEVLTEIMKKKKKQKKRIKVEVTTHERN